MRPPPDGRRHDDTGQDGKRAEGGDVSIVDEGSEVRAEVYDFPLALDGDGGVDATTTCSEHTVCPHMRVVGWSRMPSQAGQRRSE